MLVYPILDCYSKKGLGDIFKFFSMIHGLRIKDGKATYVSRHVRTSSIKREEYFGGAKFMKVYQ